MTDKMKLKLRGNPEQFKGFYSREAAALSTVNEADRSIENIVSTEDPVVVFDWYNWQPIREILLVDGLAFPESRQVPLLDVHSRFEISNIKGSTRDLQAADDPKLGRILLGRTVFSTTAEDEWTLAREGHLTDTSIGYLIDEAQSILLKKGQTTNYNGRVFTNSWEDGLDLYVRLSSQLKENSIVPIGANQAAKFRSLFNHFAMLDQDEEKQNNGNKRTIISLYQSEENKMTEEEKRAKEAADKAEKERIALAETSARDSARENETLRVRSIEMMAGDFNDKLKDVNTIKDQFIREGKSEREFYNELSKRLKDPEAVKAPAAQLGMSEAQVQDYSIRKICLYQLGKLKEDEVGLELEAHRALVDATKSYPDNDKGIFLPFEVQNRQLKTDRAMSRSQAEKLFGRSGLVTTDADGGYTIKDVYTPLSFIEYLSNASAFINAGVTFLPGVQGTIPMIRELDEYAYYHAGEGSDITSSDITFGREEMNPKKGGAMTRVSYEFLLQTSLAVEAYLTRRLGTTCALGMDRDIGYGSGVGAIPKGIKAWTGVGSVPGAGFNRASALAMESAVETANASQLGTFKFLSRGSVRSTLKNVKIIEGKWLVDDTNSMIGYNYDLVSNQFDAGDLFGGIFSEVVVPYWNMVEIAVNKFSDTVFASGDILVRALQALDVFVRNPAALVVSTGVNP